MVLIHISRSAEEFIYETTTTESVDAVTRRLAEIHNQRLRVKRLVSAVRDLAKHGPMKEEKDRGLSEEQLSALGTERKAEREEEEEETEAKAGADPLGVRVGQPPSPQLQQTLNKVCDDAEAAISSAHAKQRRPLPLALIASCIDNIRGAVLMAYPMNLPPYDTVRQIIDGSEELSGHADGAQQFAPDSAVLWFAGKALERGERLSKYVGSNEKLTIKAKLEAAGSGAPSRPPAVDEETQRRMMALWHKKEAQAKALAEQDDDSYLNSEWANPKGFKQQMHGLSAVSFKPSR